MSVDLTGLLNIQKDYVYDLSAIATNELPVSNYVNDLQDHLGRLYNDYSSSDITSQAVIDNQAKIANIVNSEQSRLEAKKTEINNQIESQGRLIELNNSYRKRQEAYLYIIFILIFSLIIIAILLKLKSVIPYPIICEVLLIIVLVFDFIYISKLLWNIFNRDRMNYDNISFKPPSDSNRNSSDLTGNSNVMTGGLLCLGQACCEGNTVWNENAKKCDIKCPMTGEPSENRINYNGRCIAESGCPAGSKVVNGFCIADPTKETFVSGSSKNRASPYSPSEYTYYGVYN